MNAEAHLNHMINLSFGILESIIIIHIFLRIFVEHVSKHLSEAHHGVSSPKWFRSKLYRYIDTVTLDDVGDMVMISILLYLLSPILAFILGNAIVMIESWSPLERFGTVAAIVSLPALYFGMTYAAKLVAQSYHPQTKSL